MRSFRLLSLLCLVAAIVRFPSSLASELSSEPSSREASSATDPGFSTSPSRESIQFVLITGLIRERRHWGEFPEKLTGALPGSTILALANPGTGGLQHQPSPLSIPEFARRLRSSAGITDRRGRRVVIGFSMGGMIATSWIEQFPDDFEAAVLINTSLGRHSWFFRRLRLANLLTFLRLGSSDEAATREQLILDLNVNHLELHDDLLPTWVGYHLEAPVTRVNALRQLLAAALYRGRSEKPPIPVLLLAGRQDRLVSSTCSQDLAEAWGVPIVWHPTAGHFLTADDPAWTAAAIARWLERSATP